MRAKRKTAKRKAAKGANAKRKNAGRRSRIVTQPDPRQFQRLLEYHHWAGDRLFEALADVSAADLDKEWGGSFRTPRALLRHIIGAEQIWLERFNGTSPRAMPEFPATHSGSDYLAEWRRCKTRESEFVRALSAGKLAASLAYTNTKGEHHSFPLSEILTHVVNHGTYHRGQLSHLVRDLGRAGVSTDYVAYLATLPKG